MSEETKNQRGKCPQCKKWFVGLSNCPECGDKYNCPLLELYCVEPDCNNVCEVSGANMGRCSAHFEQAGPVWLDYIKRNLPEEKRSQRVKEMVSYLEKGGKWSNGRKC